MKKRGLRAWRGTVAISALLMTATAAQATEGYFQLGFGPRQNAVGGAGVADSRDAMSMALNPAGIAGMGEEVQLGGALFMPFRGYDASGTGLIAPGSVDSNSNIFAMPNVAYVRPIDSASSWGLVLYGNGGMNTTYGDVPNAAPGCGGGSGVFCGGKAGVDLMQAFISADYARDLGPLKIGIAPTLAVQRFEAKGLAGFDNPLLSAHPGSVTNRGYDYSVGGGLRAGAEFNIQDWLRLGVAGQTPMFMSRFSKYNGLFAENGSFDIPASVSAGIAADVTPDITMMFDYQHIFYSGVKAVANSSTKAAQLGSSNGPGFGWHDVDVFKVGAEWRATDKWTFRAGYAYSGNPISSSDVTLNILAPGVVQHHITGGASYKFSSNDTLEFSGMYVPEVKVSGSEVTPLGVTPGSKISLHMYQLQFLAGWTHDF